MNEHSCSFEEAVRAMKEYGYKNKKIAVMYKGQYYSSLRELCKEYGVTVQALSDRMNRYQISAGIAMDYLLNGDIKEGLELNGSKRQNGTKQKANKSKHIVDKISLNYKGKKYTSLSVLCNDYEIEPADVRYWEKKFQGDLKRAVEYCIRYYS